jgi:hypothetical protein
MDTEYRIDLLKEAYDKIEEAINLIENATRGSKMEDYAEAYTISTLYSILGQGNPYDFNKISELIEGLGEEDEEEDETPEDYEVFLRRMDQ